MNFLYMKTQEKIAFCGRELSTGTIETLCLRMDDPIVRSEGYIANVGLSLPWNAFSENHDNSEYYLRVGVLTLGTPQQ